MRLRVLVPRRGRGRGQRRLTVRHAVTAAAALLVATAVASCAGDVEPRLAERADGPREQRLALGLTEFNAQLTLPASVGPPPDGFSGYRDRVEALRPRYVRVVVDWPRVQSDPSSPPDLALPQDGCLRGAPPCAPFSGLRTRLEAIREQQRLHGGWEVVVVIAWTPEWAARPARGCEQEGAEPRMRPITEDGLRAYRSLVRDLVALGRDVGVPLRWWSPFNEPNHPTFVSPQRDRCDAGAPSRSPAVYERFVRAAREELRAVGGDRRLVLGELAGFRAPGPRSTGVAEFVDALPDDVACAADVWAQHQYVRPDRRQHDAVGELRRALDRRDCTRGQPIWVTETGVGGNRVSGPRPVDEPSLKAQCRAQHAQLVEWDATAGVEAVFQYTAREDPLYPVALFDPPLRRVYPVYDVWRAWSRAGPDDPVPQLPDVCR